MTGAAAAKTKSGVEVGGEKILSAPLVMPTEKVALLLSASVERFGVPFMRDFLKIFLWFAILLGEAQSFFLKTAY